MTEPSALPSSIAPSGRRILLAEDNPQDVFLLREAFLSENIPADFDCVPDGDQLLERLLSLFAGGRDPYALVVLDAHLPKRSAEEVLCALSRQQKRLNVPVVVLTNMISDRDKEKLLGLGVCEIFSKPLDLSDYFSLVHRLAALMDPGLQMHFQRRP